MKNLHKAWVVAILVLAQSGLRWTDAASAQDTAPIPAMGINAQEAPASPEAPARPVEANKPEEAAAPDTDSSDDGSLEFRSDGTSFGFRINDRSKNRTVDLDESIDEMPVEVLNRLSQDQLQELLLARVRQPKHMDVVGALVSSLFFAFCAFVMFLSYRQKMAIEKTRNETVRLAIERGAEVPLEVFGMTRRNDLRRGIFLSALGLGIIGFFAAQGDSAWGIGLIPLLIGAAYYLNHRLQNPKGALPSASSSHLSGHLPGQE